MQITPSRIVIGLALSAAAVLCGCQTTAPIQSEQLLQETSVRPGINDSYKQENIDVSQWVERFEREGREVYDQRHRIVDSIGIHPGMAVVDIGSGSGLFTSLLADATGAEGTVYAVDIVPDFLESIQERMKQDGKDHVKTVLCTDKSVELPANSIDVAYICDVYHHFEFPLNSMTSIYRALRIGGEVILVEFEREEGKSSEWILNHVRAGKDVFTAEIESAGFRKIEEFDFLKENYMIRFRKLSP